LSSHRRALGRTGRLRPREQQANIVRVLVDTSILRRPHSGIARWVTGLVDALAHREGLEVIEAPGPRRVGNGWLFRPVNVSRQRAWYEWGIQRAAAKHRADVLLMPAGYASRRGRVPQVTAIMDVNFLTRPGTYEPLMARYLTWAFRRAVRQSDGLITISEFSRDEICLHLGVSPERFDVVYPGLVQPQSGTFASPLPGPYALYVGATEQHKNIGLLLDAWQDMPPGLSLAIVGQPGRAHEELVRRAAASAGRVVVTGRVADRELEAWYRNARLLLMPSLTEGFGFPPLEAMQRDVPVVASRAGSLPEVLGDAALYHEPDDASALRRLVLDLEEQPELRERMIGLGRRRAERYTWQAAGEALEASLAKAVAGRSGPSSGGPTGVPT
jgi:glycosyltransferase involved in cell wall biosynthesis